MSTGSCWYLDRGVPPTLARIDCTTSGSDIAGSLSSGGIFACSPRCSRTSAPPRRGGAGARRRRERRVRFSTLARGAGAAGRCSPGAQGTRGHGWSAVRSVGSYTSRLWNATPTAEARSCVSLGPQPQEWESTALGCTSGCAAAPLGFWWHLWDAGSTCGLSNVLLDPQSAQLEARIPGLHYSSSNDIFCAPEIVVCLPHSRFLTSSLIINRE